MRASQFPAHAESLVRLQCGLQARQAEPAHQIPIMRHDQRGQAQSRARSMNNWNSLPALSGSSAEVGSSANSTSGSCDSAPPATLPFADRQVGGSLSSSRPGQHLNGMAHALAIRRQTEQAARQQNILRTDGRQAAGLQHKPMRDARKAARAGSSSRPSSAATSTFSPSAYARTLGLQQQADAFQQSAFATAAAARPPTRRRAPRLADGLRRQNRPARAAAHHQ